jgi:PB1 domain
MQLKFKLRHKGSTQKLHMSSLPTWSTIAERIGRAFSLPPEDIALAYKGKDDTETLVTSREELDQYIKVNDVQRTGKTMEFEVRDSQGWSSQAGSEMGGARISGEYDDIPDAPPRSPPGFTYVTQLPHHHNPHFFSDADMFASSGFNGHTPVIQVMPLRGMDLDAFSTAFIETVPTSEENINPEGIPVQHDTDIDTASVTSVDEPLKIPAKDKGKGKAQEASTGRQPPDLLNNDGHVDNKPAIHVPNYADPPTPIAIPSHSQDEHVRNHNRSAGSITPRAAHDALTDDGAPPTTTLDVGSVEAINHLSQLFGTMTDFLRAYPTISQNMRDVLSGFHGLDLNKEVEATRDADGKTRQRMHQVEMDVAQRNLMRSALEMMRQFSKAMEPGAIDSPGDYSFPQIDVPVPVPQGVTRPATYTSAADRVSLPPAPPEILAGLDSRARLEAAKALYKQEKERYKEEREKKRKERMGRIARYALLP